MTNLFESLHDSATPRHSTKSPLKAVDSSPDVAALLLTNVATIASNELNHSVLVKPQLYDPSAMSLPCRIVPGEMTCACLHYDYGRNTPPSMVSSDDDETFVADSPVPMIETESNSAVYCHPILPTSCPSMDEKSSLITKRSKRHTANECIVQKPLAVREMLPKKFSWKNYPELEDFLIAHREEYLQHSKRNYSIQQKQFNNKLTEDLLELATEHGYVFHDLTFVMLRDKVRCYYKSYLQTLRKKQHQRR